MQTSLLTSSKLSEQEKLDWLQLFRTENIGPITFYKLLEIYGSAAGALDALPHLAKKAGRKTPLIAANRNAVEKEYKAIKKYGGDIVCACEQPYPLSLSSIEDAPPVLTYVGNLGFARLPCLAIVGARNASLNGKKFAFKLAQDLGRNEQIIVSGLARGIDTAAHEGALATGTIAVVAGGLDKIYPSENTKLYEAIKDQGLIIAESPWGMEPVARHFPKRNRIVSGLATGTIVIEATLKSGSLITARMAAEQGRDVYAVPGYPADPRAAGPNKLIQDGALLLQSAQDILQNLSNFGRTNLRVSALPSYLAPQTFEQNWPDRDTGSVRTIILQNISQMPVGVDELARTCHVSIPSMQMALVELELAGQIGRLPGNRIVLLDE